MKIKNKIEEKKLTKAELEAREKVIKDLKKNKSALVKRYGKDAEAVMYGRATNIAKKMAESENKNRIKELIRKSLMHEADIEVDADKYEGEKELGQVSMMMDELESLLKGFDWYYYMSDDPRVYNRWGATDNQISKLERELTAMGYGEDVKTLHNQYAPDDRHKIKEGKKEDVDGDGDIDSKDYLAKRDAAIKKAKGDVKEDIDLGHEDNEPHMLKGDLYRIGKYAMELYQMVDEFEGKGEVDFPHWWQSKVIKAKEMLVSAKHYLDFETKEPEIDAMVNAIDQVDALDNIGVDQPVFEEEVGEVDKLAAKIAKALKSNTSDEDQNNIKQARKAMNNGDIEAAKKILKPYIDEGIFDRIKSKISGATATVKTTAGNIGAAVKGDPSSFKNTATASGMAKLSTRAKSLDKEFTDIQNDINKLFPEEKLKSQPELKKVIDAYKNSINSAKKINTQVASGKLDNPNLNQTQPAKEETAKTGPTRDEKGRFTSTKTSTSAPKTNPISDKYEVTNDVYNYKGKDYTVQVDKDTKKKFFKNDDGRIMDISSLEKFSQAKKKAVAEKLAKQLKFK